MEVEPGLGDETLDEKQRRQLIVFPDLPSVLILGVDPNTVPGMGGGTIRAVLDPKPARFGAHALPMPT